jgi:hypothetical protein
MTISFTPIPRPSSANRAGLAKKKNYDAMLGNGKTASMRSDASWANH